MGEVQRSWERLSEIEKEKAIEAIVHFFEIERDEKIGAVAAERLLNHFLQTVGTDLYNKGVLEAKKAVKYRLDGLNYDLEDLLDL